MAGLEKLWLDGCEAKIECVLCCSRRAQGRISEMVEVKFYDNVDDESFGMLFLSDRVSFEEIHNEIERILITDELVDNWTYPLIQPKLLEEARNRGYL